MWKEEEVSAEVGWMKRWPTKDRNHLHNPIVGVLNSLGDIDDDTLIKFLLMKLLDTATTTVTDLGIYQSIHNKQKKKLSTGLGIRARLRTTTTILCRFLFNCLCLNEVLLFALHYIHIMLCKQLYPQTVYPGRMVVEVKGNTSTALIRFVVAQWKLVPIAIKLCKNGQLELYVGGVNSQLLSS